jgi:hypothetical protein
MSWTCLCGLVVKRSWLQLQRSRVRFLTLTDFSEAVDLERGLLSLLSTIEDLLERKSSGSDLKRREYGRRDPLRWPRETIYPQNLALTSSKAAVPLTFKNLGSYLTAFQLHSKLIPFRKIIFELVQFCFLSAPCWLLAWFNLRPSKRGRFTLRNVVSFSANYKASYTS